MEVYHSHLNPPKKYVGPTFIKSQSWAKLMGYEPIFLTIPHMNEIDGIYNDMLTLRVIKKPVVHGPAQAWPDPNLRTELQEYCPIE